MRLVNHIPCPNDDFSVRVLMDLSQCQYFITKDISIDNTTPGPIMELIFKSRDYTTINIISVAALELSDMYNSIMETSVDYRSFFIAGINEALKV